MTHRYGIATWGLPLSGLLLVAGASMVWLAALLGGLGGRAIAVAAAVVLFSSAASMLVATASARVRRDSADRKLDKYACGVCGYEPHVDVIEHAQAYSCQTCGRTVYGK